MRFTAPIFLLASANAFVPTSPLRLAIKSTSSSARPFGVDPHVFHDLPQQWDTVQNFFSSISIADATEAAQQVTDAAATDNGWFGFLTIPIEGLLQGIHTALNTMGLKTNSWGVSIILLTILIKVVTFPLTKTQLESTNKMQALQPAIKEIQTKYQSNPEVMNQKIAEFYQVNEINPLAGCFPALVQIPVFIGLYRAVLDLAGQNKLDEPFLFLPNLEGPTYGADPASGSDWLFKGWTDGVPSLGWGDTIAFLILPIVLIVSQYLSMQLMQPTTDSSQQQNNIILKILPIMIGWFALNVPAALSVYWVVNNIVTTVTSVLVRNNMKTETVTPGSGTTTSTRSPEPTIFAPPREKPQGFAPSQTAKDIKPLTAMDAEIVEDDDDDDDDEESTPSGTGMAQSSEQSKGKKRGGKKKRKN